MHIFDALYKYIKRPHTKESNQLVLLLLTKAFEGELSSPEITRFIPFLHSLRSTADEKLERTIESLLALDPSLDETVSSTELFSAGLSSSSVPSEQLLAQSSSLLSSFASEYPFEFTAEELAMETPPSLTREERMLVEDEGADELEELGIHSDVALAARRYVAALAKERASSSSSSSSSSSTDYGMGYDDTNEEGDNSEKQPNAALEESIVATLKEFEDAQNALDTEMDRIKQLLARMNTNSTGESSSSTDLSDEIANRSQSNTERRSSKSTTNQKDNSKECG